MQLFLLAFFLLFLNESFCSLKIFWGVRLMRLESQRSKINRVIDGAYILLVSSSSLARFLTPFRITLFNLDICLLNWSSSRRHSFSYNICLLIFTVKVFKVIIDSKALAFISLLLWSLGCFSFSLRLLWLLWLGWGWAADSLKLNLDGLLVIRVRFILQWDLWYGLLIVWKTTISTQVFWT